MKDPNLEKMKEHLLEATYYHKMYASPACWKGDVKVVYAKLAKLKSKDAKLDVLNENIQMRVKGCRWEKSHTTWSHKRRERTVKELANHLKWVITWDIDEDMPEDPHIKVHERKNDASLGTCTDEIKDIGSKFAARTEAIRGDLEKLR